MRNSVGNFFHYIIALVLPLSSLVAEKPIVILTTSYNNREWAPRNIDSILRQDYYNYRVIYVDDASTDGTADIVEELVKRYPKRFAFHLIRNSKRAGALANIYSAIHEHCQDEEIVVSVDGDDWLPDVNVLKRIDSAYSSGEIWLTHGTMLEYPLGGLGWSIPVPREIIQANAFRKYRCPSHLRTFYAWLFKKIKTEDLHYQGQFFPMTWDQAMMFPMCEMTGERQAFVSTISYVYNMANAINDNKVDPGLQNHLEAVIRAMPPYKRLEKEEVGIRLCQFDDRNRKAMDYVGTRPAGGAIQLQLLQREGLQRSDYVLEIGSGALLSGIPIMSFLEKGHYFGIDPNPWLMEQTLMIDQNRKIAEACQPVFLQREDFDAQSAGILFDYVFAHSIMSHAAHWQLPLFLKNASQILKENGKLVFSIRLTEPNGYGSEGADKETQAAEWQYPGCSFFAMETVINEAKKWFRTVEYKKEYTPLLTANNAGAYHDWFVLTK